MEILTASTVDGRMGGAPLPVMSSGGSGNQGVIAILVPYKIGKYNKIPEKRILESIALSHILNAYVKCFSGELSPICGCAIGAGVGATAAIVYQKTKNIKKISDAINNLLARIAGMICDGAKGSCALKVSSATNTVIKSAFLSLDGFAAKPKGFISKKAEKTIQNLGKITEKGMEKVDEVILEVMEHS